MARKADLRRQREATVINLTSKKQETELGRALRAVETRIQDEFEVLLDHRSSWPLSDIIKALKAEFPDVPFGQPGQRSSMKPDGGILSIVDHDHGLHPILISEVKNQGTNTERLAEGKPRQAQGNAIERLGKNVIGFRTAMLPEGIMPFICFGYGCDRRVDASSARAVRLRSPAGWLRQRGRNGCGVSLAHAAAGTNRRVWHCPSGITVSAVASGISCQAPGRSVRGSETTTWSSSR